ncbi:hypothetical protein N7501_005761 [Penicillium viridicatum]|nr:hypothetical protein N7501_005761 [Penicillium viridicatum]
MKSNEAPLGHISQRYIDAENYDWVHFKDIPTVRCVADNLILIYYHGRLTLARPTNIVGFYPGFGPTYSRVAK